MNFRNDVNKIMKNVQVDEKMTNEILNQTTRRNKAHAFGKKRVAVVAMAAVLCIGSVAVAANEVTGFWNNIVDRFMQVEEQEKTELIEKGYVDTGDEKNVSATAEGITVSLLQTVADKKGMYIYLNVKSDKIKLEENMFFNICYVSLEGKGRIEKRVDGINLISENEGVVELYAGADIDDFGLDIEGKKIEVILSDLQNISMQNDEIDYRTVTNSKWELRWIGKNSGDSKVIPLNNSIVQDNVTIKLKKMEITPLSVKIEYNTSKWDPMEGPDWLDIPFTIVMKDGSIFELPEDGSGEKGAEQGGSCEVIDFAKVLNIYSIDHVIVGGTSYDVN